MIKKILPLALTAVSVFLVTVPWPWTTEVWYGGQDWVKGQTPNTEPLDTERFSRMNVYILAADSEELEAWLYIPKSEVVLVVLALPSC
jgi:hypothetical protein